MEVQLNIEQIQEVVSEKTVEAVKHAWESYATTQAIADVLANSIAHGVIGEAVQKALSKIDIETLSQRLAEEMSRATVRAVNEILKEG